MKIIYISSSIIPSRNANSIHVMRMCQAFADNGHNVTLLAPHQVHRYEESVNDIFKYYGVRENFTIKKLPSPNIRGTSWVYTFFIWLFLLKHKDAELVYARSLHGCFVASKLAFPVIFESHARDFEHVGYQKMLFTSLIKSPHLRFLVVISQALKEMYVKANIIDEAKIIVAHDGADEVTDFDNKIELVGNLDTLKVGYVGHLYQGRGVDLIFYCAEKLPEASFHLVGGTVADINYWQEYLENKKIDNVHLYGFVNPSKATAFRNSFDILLAPYAKQVRLSGNVGDTSSFMSPLKIFEYMSHGKAIIVSDLPVLKEVLTESNSLMVEPENVSEWLKAINEFKNKELREEKGKKALKDFQQYTWRRRAEKLIDVFSRK